MTFTLAHKLLCQSPTFNDLAQNAAECLRCFCFGVSEHCHSSSVEAKAITLFEDTSGGGDHQVDPHNFHLPLTVVPMERALNGSYVDVSDQHPPNQRAIRYDPFSRSHQVTSEVASMSTPDGVHFYWRLPGPAFTGSKLYSYGGYLRYTIRYQKPFTPTPLSIPDVILKGNGITLYHYERQDNGLGVEAPDESIKVAVRFWVGEWHRDSSNANLLNARMIDGDGAHMPPLFDVSSGFLFLKLTKKTFCLGHNSRRLDDRSTKHFSNSH